MKLIKKNKKLFRILTAGLLTFGVVFLSFKFYEKHIKAPQEKDCTGEMCPYPEEKTDAGKPKKEDGGVFLPIYVATPKENALIDCVTSNSYEYVDKAVWHDHKQGIHISVHSQVVYEPEKMYTPQEIHDLLIVTLKAWERKFDTSAQLENMANYLASANTSHVVYTKNKKQFDKLLKIEDPENTTIAMIIKPGFSCVETPFNIQPLIIMRPKSYLKDEVPYPGVYVIHEFIHLLSYHMNGVLDADHENEKLWLKHDTKRSVQALALFTYMDECETKEPIEKSCF